jgi:cyclophilin family peptidyl-prolyl cis-trans isomerase
MGRGRPGDGACAAAAKSAPTSRRHISELGRTSLLSRCDSSDGYGGEVDEDSASSSCSSLTSDEPWSAVFMRPTSSSMLDGAAVSPASASTTTATAHEEKKAESDSAAGRAAAPPVLRAAFRESRAVQFHQGRHPHQSSMLLHQQQHEGDSSALGGDEEQQQREYDVGLVFVPHLGGGGGDAVHPTSSRGGGGNSKSYGEVGTRGTGRATNPALSSTFHSGIRPPPPPYGSVVCFLVFSSCPRDRLVVELFQDQVPVAANMFQELCCLQEPRRRGQVGSIVQRIVPNSFVQVGDDTGAGRVPGKPPTGCPAEPLFQHSEPGLLSIAMAGPSGAGETAPASHFFITVRPMPHFDGRHAVFGRVLIGMDSVVHQLAHNTALDDRQRPMFERIGIVDCGHIIHGKEVRLEEPSSPRRALPMDSRPEASPADECEANGTDATIPLEATTAAPSSVFAFAALKVAALAAVSCDAFSPFASVAASDPNDGTQGLLLPTPNPKTSTLFDSLSTESEADTESLVPGPAVASSKEVTQVPDFVPVEPTKEPTVGAAGAAGAPVSPTETLPVAPTIPFSFSTFSATSTLTEVSAFLRSPFKGTTSPHEAEGGARSPSNEMLPHGPPQGVVHHARGASHVDDRDPPAVAAVQPGKPKPTARTSTTALKPDFQQRQQQQLPVQVRHGSTFSSDAPASIDNNVSEGATRTWSSSSRGSKLEPPGLVFGDGASAFGAAEGQGGTVPILGSGDSRGTDPGADTIASSHSLQDFLTTSEDAVAEFLYPASLGATAAAASQGSDGLCEDAMDSPNSQVVGVAVLSIGSSDSDVEHKALPGVSVTARFAADRTGLADNNGGEQEMGNGNNEPPNLYSISYSTVAGSGSLLAGSSPSAQGPQDCRPRPGRLGSRSSCTDSLDDTENDDDEEDEDDSLLQSSRTFESTLDGGGPSSSSTSTSTASAPYTFISSSSPFGWARAGRCGSDPYASTTTTTSVRRRLLVAAGADPPPGGLVSRRLVPARLGPPAAAASSMTTTATRSATPPVGLELRFGCHRLRRRAVGRHEPQPAVGLAARSLHAGTRWCGPIPVLLPSRPRALPSGR